jgi:hypothetical protein
MPTAERSKGNVAGDIPPQEYADGHVGTAVTQIPEFLSPQLPYGRHIRMDNGNAAV